MTNLIKSLSPQELQSWNVRPDSKVEYYDGKILVVSDPEPEAPFGVAAKAGTALLFGIAVFTHAPFVGVVFGAYAVAKVLGTVSDLYGGDNALMTRLEQDLGISEPPAIGSATRLGAVEVPAAPVPTVAPGLDVNPETPTQSASPELDSAQVLFNPAIDLGQNPQSALIVGTPGSGKGMIVSNAVRIFRQKAPGLKVMMIDPKGDPQEKGYWAPVVDIYRPFDLMNCDDPDEGASWLLACMDEFRKLPAPKLLIFDELMASATELELADPKMKALARLKKFVVGIVGLGDSRAIWLWAVTQSPQVKDLGISGGVRANLRILGLVSFKNMAAVNALLSTQLIPKPDGGIEELRAIMKASPANRVFYDGKVSRWLPMPKLENHSGFDRDNRTIEAEPTTTNNQPASNQKKPAEAPKQIETDNDALDDELSEVELDKPSPEAIAQAKKEVFEIGQAILELLRNNPDKSYSDESLRTHRFIREKLGKAPAIGAIRISIKAIQSTQFVRTDSKGQIQWK
ncbi:hypothetical protein ACKFKG_26805 [Phormidesmis sp. 146-35]